MIWLAVGVVIYLVVIGFALALCRVAGDADEAMERWHG